jgi:hypothetical protein
LAVMTVMRWEMTQVDIVRRLEMSQTIISSG